jgi:hypothetical protein
MALRIQWYQPIINISTTEFRYIEYIPSTILVLKSEVYQSTKKGCSMIEVTSLFCWFFEMKFGRLLLIWKKEQNFTKRQKKNAPHRSIETKAEKSTTNWKYWINIKFAFPFIFLSREWRGQLMTNWLVGWQ